MLFFFFSLYLVNLGVTKYQGFFSEKENFLDYEKQKVKQYVNYEQYGAYGFRVLFQPAPLSIFHRSPSIPFNGSIDTKEIVNVSLNYKGKSIFSHSGTLGDFSSTLFVFGSLMMLYFGLNTFTSLKSLRFNNPHCGTHKMKYSYTLHTLFSRMILLNAYFSGVMIAAYLFARLKGIHFLSSDALILTYFCLYTLLFNTFFYLLGILCAAILAFKRPLFIIAYSLWFALIFLIPEINRIDIEKKANKITSNETVNIKKLQNIMNFERKTKTYFAGLQEKKVKDIESIAKRLAIEYSQRMYDLNKTIENNLRKEVDKLIHYGEEKSVAIPSSFYLFLAKEFSGYGYDGYQNFLQYILRLKDDFFQYYLQKRYNHVDQRIDTFVKDGENIFRSEVTIPGNFARGVILTCLYCTLLLGLSLFFFRRRLTREKEDQDWEIEIDIKRMEKGKTYFSLCRDKWERKRMLHYLGYQGASIIEKLDIYDFDTSISLESWIKYECHKRGTEAGDVFERLREFGISENMLTSRIKVLGSEIFNKIYLAIRLCDNSRIYAFVDFLNGVSRDFERQFKKTIKKVKDQAVILYIGSEMFDVNVKERETPLEDSRFFILDFDNVTLR